MAKEDCIFCKIVAGQIPSLKIYEDETIYSFLDVGPLSQGHTLVIPRDHYEKLHECSPDVIASIGSRIGKIAEAVIKAMGVDAYNVLSNTGRAAGQLVDHIHFHIIPRKMDDGVFTQWPAKQYQQGQAEKIAESIREKLLIA